jgi:hypothetical protein
MPKRAKKEESELKQKYGQSPFVFVGTIIILIIVVIAFILVPAIVPEARGGADLTFGYYDGAPISYVPDNFFDRTYKGLAEQYRNIQGGGFDRYIWNQAYSMAALSTAILRESEVHGNVPPAEVINKKVAQLPELRENGRFNTVIWRNLSEQVQLQIVRDTKESLQIQEYLSDMQGILISSGEKKFIAGMGEAQRSFAVASWTITDFPDSEVTAYIGRNEDVFKKIKLSRVTFEKEADAKRVLAEIKDGKTTFEEAAQSHSIDEDKDKLGDMGEKFSHELSAVIPDESARNTVLALPANEYSGVVKVGQGFGIFRVDTPLHEANAADASVINNARSYIMNNERSVFENYYLKKAEAFTENARQSGFDAAIESEGISKKTVGPLPLNYGGENLFPTLSSFGESALYNAQTKDGFWRAAFKTPLNEPSAPFVNENYVIVLYPTEEKQLDSSETESITNYFEDQIANGTESSLSTVLLSDTNKKYKDNFQATYDKYFSPSGL